MPLQERIWGVFQNHLSFSSLCWRPLYAYIYIYAHTYTDQKNLVFKKYIYIAWTQSMNLKHAAVILDLSYIYSQGDLKSNLVKNGNDLLMLRVSLHVSLWCTSGYRSDLIQWPYKKSLIMIAKACLISVIFRLEVRGCLANWAPSTFSSRSYYSTNCPY